MDSYEQLKKRYDDLNAKRLSATRALDEINEEYRAAKSDLENANYVSGLKYIGRYMVPQDIIDADKLVKEISSDDPYVEFVSSDELSEATQKSVKLKKGDILLGYLDEYDLMAFFQEGVKPSMENEIKIYEDQLIKL